MAMQLWTSKIFLCAPSLGSWFKLGDISTPNLSKLLEEKEKLIRENRIFLFDKYYDDNIHGRTVTCSASCGLWTGMLWYWLPINFHWLSRLNLVTYLVIKITINYRNYYWLSKYGLIMTIPKSGLIMIIWKCGLIMMDHGISIIKIKISYRNNNWLSLYQSMVWLVWLFTPKTQLTLLKNTGSSVNL